MENLRPTLHVASVESDTLSSTVTQAPGGCVCYSLIVGLACVGSQLCSAWNGSDVWGTVGKLCVHCFWMCLDCFGVEFPFKLCHSLPLVFAGPGPESTVAGSIPQGASRATVCSSLCSQGDWIVHEEPYLQTSQPLDDGHHERFGWASPGTQS